MMKDIRCPECQSKHIVKRGKRKQRFRVIQTYQCKECKRRFEDKILPYKMYPARVISTAINQYNLGHTLEETSRTVNRMFKVKTSKSTVHLWIMEFQSLSPISSLRNNFFGHDGVLFTKRFEHENLEYVFMIINDKATVACEVPVWYWEKSIDNGVTGHIDILQVRRGNVYILDYKPGASKDKKAPQQLYHYALALSFRTKMPLEDIRCAWFDKDVYFEYDPAKADATLVKNNKKRRL